MTRQSAIDAGKEIVRRRHPDWTENRVRWRWLLDSYEGGDRYRNAVYGMDRRGLPVRNLVRHKREYPDAADNPGYVAGYAGVPSVSSDMAGAGYAAGLPGFLGSDPNATAADDDYEVRRSRTPVPNWTEDVVETHLGKIFDHEVKRDAETNPPELVEWWGDVDGCGTPIDEWVSQTIAPLLMVVGHLDILFDHPKAPAGKAVATKADELRYGLNRCVASYILPENMVWWRLDVSGRYTEALVMEYIDPSDWTAPPSSGMGEAMQAWGRSLIRYRHWTDEEWTLYDADGDTLDADEHRYQCVPIVRLIDVRKHRTPHCGKPRYEVVAELQRAYYNLDSELVLSNTLQAHPLLSGPEDYAQGDSTLSVGPGFLLPMKKNNSTGAYDGHWEYVSPPKDPAESIRKCLKDIADQKDIAAKLTKPAGAAGTSGNSVSQSGVSKQLDSSTGNKYLTRMARVLARAERQMAECALCVLKNGPMDKATLDKIKVVYPSRFDLFDVNELVAGITEFQGAVALAGEAPLAEKLLLQSLIRLLLPGLEDEEYGELDDELDGIMEAKAATKEAYKEANLAAVERMAEGEGVADDSGEGSGGDPAARSQSDPTGQSAATAVTPSYYLNQ